MSFLGIHIKLPSIRIGPITLGVVPNFHWLSNAVRAAGRDIGSAVHFVEKETGKIEHAVMKVPFIGPLFIAIVDLANTPFTVGRDILEGKNVAKSLVHSLKSDLKDVKEIAPYVQMVVSFIPGIGPEVSAAIGMGVALAEGQPIDKILLAGAKGAMPGGPLAAAAFGAAVGAVTAIANHEPLAEGLLHTALDAIPLPSGAAGDACRTALGSAIKMTGAIAKGEKVDVALMNAASANLSSLKDIPGMPSGVAQALQTSAGVGLAMGTGVVAQAHLKKASAAPDVLEKLRVIGENEMATDPVTAAAAKPFPKGLRGFQIGIGMMQHEIGITSFTSVRDAVKGGKGNDDQKAFDVATSLHIGRVTTIPVAGLSADAVAGAAITHGLRCANEDAASELATAVAATPGLQEGAAIAKKQIQGLPVILATGTGIVVMGIAACAGISIVATYALGALTAGGVLLLKRS